MFLKTALNKASFFSALLALCLCACGDLGGDPAANGARFDRHFYFYYVQSCQFNSIGPFNCSSIRSISPPVSVGIRVDSDGFANLKVDADRYYYMESEYDEDYDPDYGGYFRFYEDDTELVIYKDGWEMSVWDNWEETVTYYFYDLY
ncbi:hypothetical protein [uncultured Fibrobacter sp.]|uniref:hypothetical protein n=1 Tax=uncultured Fibrobacter sp. TaxID=261512 RepID=UPI00261915B6|nr:hypothetical protein [uncultured Fibrobacter sp.]